MCMNLSTHSEEPLALQKLMLKHVKNISGVKVLHVGENNFHSISQLGKDEQ